MCMTELFHFILYEKVRNSRIKFSKVKLLYFNNAEKNK